MTQPLGFAARRALGAQQIFPFGFGAPEVGDVHARSDVARQPAGRVLEERHRRLRDPAPVAIVAAETIFDAKGLSGLESLRVRGENAGQVIGMYVVRPA